MNLAHSICLLLLPLRGKQIRFRQSRQSEISLLRPNRVSVHCPTRWNVPFLSHFSVSVMETAKNGMLVTCFHFPIDGFSENFTIFWLNSIYINNNYAMNCHPAPVLIGGKLSCSSSFISYFLRSIFTHSRARLNAFFSFEFFFMWFSGSISVYTFMHFTGLSFHLVPATTWTRSKSKLNEKCFTILLEMA